MLTELGQGHHFRKGRCRKRNGEDLDGGVLKQLRQDREFFRLLRGSGHQEDRRGLDVAPESSWSLIPGITWPGPDPIDKFSA